MEHPELMEQVETLRKSFEVLLPCELERLIAEGFLNPQAREADYNAQVFLVTRGSENMRWLDNQIHALNMEWNIAEGLY